MIAGTRSLEGPVLGVHMTGIGAIVKLTEDLGGWRMGGALASPSVGVSRAGESMGNDLRRLTERGGQMWGSGWETTSRRAGGSGTSQKEGNGTGGGASDARKEEKHSGRSEGVRVMPASVILVQAPILSGKQPPLLAHRGWAWLARRSKPVGHMEARRTAKGPTTRGIARRQKGGRGDHASRQVSHASRSEGKKGGERVGDMRARRILRRRTVWENAEGISSRGRGEFWEG